jgi:hypothetical protein
MAMKKSRGDLHIWDFLIKKSDTPNWKVDLTRCWVTECKGEKFHVLQLADKIGKQNKSWVGDYWEEVFFPFGYILVIEVEVIE